MINFLNYVIACSELETVLHPRITEAPVSEKNLTREKFSLFFPRSTEIFTWKHNLSSNRDK